MTPALPWGRLDGPTLLTARWVVAHRDGRHVLLEQGRASMQEGVIPGIDWDALAAEAQAQFGWVMARHPERTLGHPPVEEIFSSAYPVVRP